MTLRLRTFLVVLLASVALPVSAQGWYVGASVGRAKAADAGSNVSSGVNEACAVAITAGATGCAAFVNYDENRTGASFFAGQKYGRYVGAEVGYVDLGTYDLSGSFLVSGSGGTATLFGSEEDKASATYIDAVLTYPVTPVVSVFGKVGIAYMHNEESCSLSGAVCGSHTDNSWEPDFSIGVGTEITPTVGLRLAYSQFNSVGDSNYEYTAGNFRYLELAGIVHFR